MKPKSWFFGKLSRISKPPATLMIRKNERMQVISIRDEAEMLEEEQRSTMGPKERHA